MPWNYLWNTLKICPPSLYWMCQYLVLSHSLKLLNGLTYFEGFWVFGYQCHHISHPRIVLVEHTLNSSFDCASILDQPCLGGLSSLTMKKVPDRLWDFVSGLCIFIFFPYSSWRTEPFKVKMAWSDTPMVWPRKSKSLQRPFFTCVFVRDPMSTKRAHRDPNFLKNSPTPI